MIDREQFARHVRESLGRIYDREYLEGHPLRECLVASPEPGSVETLQQILFEAIQQLKPSRGSPQFEQRLRRYEHARLRYLEGAAPTAIAEQLGVGERQVRRDHQEVVDAVVSILWSRHSRLRWARSASAAEAAQTPPAPDALGDELRRIASTPVERPIGLPEVAAGVLATLARLAESRRVNLRLSFPEPLPAVIVDRVILRQTLLSLLSYAINSDGSERIEVSAQPTGHRLQLRVAIRRRAAAVASDRGPGEHRSGVLIGASAQLVELQGGVLERRGEGTAEEELFLSLPCSPLTTVLVIDDNPDFVRLFQRYLADGPFRVIQAGVATEALGIARQAQPDVITLDVMMPAQDGWETLQELKGDARTRRIPVLVCSVLPEPSLALSLGAAEFLAKPITRQALLGALERCLRLAAPGAR
jgi:CheY-like chemotaxis protein